ncbi:unnamed protein product [Orchesella dallaii]|uniref:Uncharacterized protein n=1 Tax=Orchesella dallaii TaxID=48710 RepID=A0ABP1QQL6_9HEXA
MWIFATKESATHAIVAVHNTEINGQTVKCSWGKEAGDPANVSSQVSTQQYGYGSVAGAQYPYYGQQMGYWYPQGYPAAAQMQNQFLQGMQGYSYGNYGYQQGFMGNVGAMQGMTTWGQGMTGGATAATQQMTGAAAQNAAAAAAAAIQQPTAAAAAGMMAAAAYPMQQFQV